MSVKLLGFPWDEMSSYLRGPAEAPARIRQVMASGSSNLCSEDGLDLSENPDFEVLGDMPLEEGEQAVAQIEATVREFLGRGHRVLSLGGDHAVTYPILRAYGHKYRELSILHFDAHPDLYEEFEGNRLSHACPFARIMEEGLAQRLVQVGIRTINEHQRAQIERYGVEVHEARQVERGMRIEFSGPVYLSFDLDGIDPSEAPGVSHHEPGG
ncbi:MAG: arginase family protein, partial [Planctomycetota bacterium]